MEGALSWAAALAEGQARLQRPDPLGALPFLDYATAPQAPYNEQADAHAALARIRTGLGQDAVAEMHYRAILALRPTQPEAMFLLGRALLRLDWPDLALGRFALLPQPVGGWWRAILRQAERRIAWARGEVRAAIATLRAAQAEPAQPAAALVRALIRAGRLSPAARLLALLPHTPERRWLAALLLLRRREGVADRALRLALRPAPGASPDLAQEAARHLLAIGEVEAAAEALAAHPPRRKGVEIRARLLIAQGRFAELAAEAGAELERRREHTEPARRLLTCQVLAGQVAVLKAASLPAAVAPPLALVQFWHSAEPPPEVRAVMDSWVRHHPGLTLARFDSASARAFILAQHGEKSARGYDTLHNPALQANMLRLCYLAVQGGLWVDADERCLRPMDEVLALLGRFGLIAPFSDELPYYVHNYMLAAPPGSPVMAALMEAQMRLLREALRGGPGLQNWVSNGPGLVTRIAARLPGQVALLAPAYWRSFAGDAADLPYKRDERADWRSAPHPPSAG
jgi:hypothetical protein